MNEKSLIRGNEIMAEIEEVKYAIHTLELMNSFTSPFKIFGESDQYGYRSVYVSPITAKKVIADSLQEKQFILKQLQEELEDL